MIPHGKAHKIVGVPLRLQPSWSWNSSKSSHIFLLTHGTHGSNFYLLLTSRFVLHCFSECNVSLNFENFRMISTHNHFFHHLFPAFFFFKEWSEWLPRSLHVSAEIRNQERSFKFLMAEAFCAKLCLGKKFYFSLHSYSFYINLSVTTGVLFIYFSITSASS